MKPYADGRTKSPERVQIDRLARWVSTEVDAQVDPSCLSFAALRRMDYDPIAYLGEMAITALVRKPDLYHVAHPTKDRVLAREAEEWLWPLMKAGLLSVLARSFVYGAIPYVLDWGQGDLVVRVPGKNTRTRSGYMSFVKVSELRPDNVFALQDARGEIVGLEDSSGGRVYDPTRGRLAIWDKQFGELQGQGARRRAWLPFAKGRIFSVFHARYLERTVHTPLLIYAPGNDVQSDDDGLTEEMTVGDYVACQIEQLMGGGSMTLPADRDSSGERLYDLRPLELPERSEVFERSLDRFDGEKLAAYLVPPAMGTMVDGSIGGGAARVLQNLFATFVGMVVSHVANELTGIVEAVHYMNNPRSSKHLPAEVGANEIPAQVQKLYLDVLGKVGDAARLGERVDLDQMLDHMGVPRTAADVDEQPSPGGTPSAPGTPGPDQQRTSKREERREDAETDEGQEDTGKPRDDAGEPE